jgi:hypothetical protein
VGIGGVCVDILGLINKRPLKQQRDNGFELRISECNEKIDVKCLENDSNGRAQRFFNGEGDCQGAPVRRIVDVKILWIGLTFDSVLVMSSIFCEVCIEVIRKTWRRGGGDVVEVGWKKAALNRSRQSGRQ